MSHPEESGVALLFIHKRFEQYLFSLPAGAEKMTYYFLNSLTTD